ncbi:MAG TPA: helix-turn-helix domain-containing protein [Tepidisphaeraceae bacterium]|nr:helix-turn-helix domain-containing protein [Tepidisphaeraceae bacterium]
MPHSELVQSLLRAVDVMELVAQSDRGLSLSEVCASLGLKQPTAHNLIRTLVAREFVEKTSNPVRYRLGSAVVRLAEERANHAIVRQASEAMQELFDRLRRELPAKLLPEEEATISFSQHVGGEVVMLLRLRAKRPGVLERPRLTMSAYESAAPLCFQAFWSPEELEDYRRRHPFLDQGSPIWKTRERLEVFLDRVRELGYAQPPIFPRGQFRVAVPIFGEGHQLLGVLGAGIWLKSAMPDAKKFIRQMLFATRLIAKGL